jgi:hypothetical protein
MSTREHTRLQQIQDDIRGWRHWGPYVGDRSWATVREDYSSDGNAWGYLPHDLARSKAYRWGEDGIAGICDRYQLLVFAPAFWNGNDPILKERLFGVTPTEGNHGEDVKEYYFHLDNTPTHSYMKFLYKYPQAEFPYGLLTEENHRRGGQGSEYELLDTGVFDQDRYFDIVIEYAKVNEEDIAIRIEAFNRGPAAAPLPMARDPILAPLACHDRRFQEMLRLLTTAVNPPMFPEKTRTHKRRSHTPSMFGDREPRRNR